MVLNIRVLTPDRVICSTTADEVVLPGLTGQVGVLDGHAALITALDTGLLRIKLDNKWTPIILCGGLAEIDKNRVTVLVNDVEELVSLVERPAVQLQVQPVHAPRHPRAQARRTVRSPPVHLADVLVQRSDLVGIGRGDVGDVDCDQSPDPCDLRARRGRVVAAARRGDPARARAAARLPADRRGRHFRTRPAGARPGARHDTAARCGGAAP